MVNQTALLGGVARLLSWKDEIVKRSSNLHFWRRRSRCFQWVIKIHRTQHSSSRSPVNCAQGRYQTWQSTQECSMAKLWLERSCKKKFNRSKESHLSRHQCDRTKTRCDSARGTLHLPTFWEWLIEDGKWREGKGSGRVGGGDNTKINLILKDDESDDWTGTEVLHVWQLRANLEKICPKMACDGQLCYLGKYLYQQNVIM